MAVAALVLLLAGCAPYVDKFKAACDEAGGELLESSQTKSTVGVGVSPKDGTPVVTSGSVTFTLRICLADDGTVIDAVLE